MLLNFSVKYKACGLIMDKNFKRIHVNSTSSAIVLGKQSLPDSRGEQERRSQFFRQITPMK